jgi:Zn-finger domain-containing protein
MNGPEVIVMGYSWGAVDSKKEKKTHSTSQWFRTETHYQIMLLQHLP